MKKEHLFNIIIILLSFMLCACAFQSKELFTTHQQGDYFKWTLTSRLGQALEMAEERYGQRDLTWTLLGVEIYDKMAPQTWYLNQDRGQKQIIVRLGGLNTWSEKSALYALSHEVIHVLSPVAHQNDVTVFEEGLAVYYSIQYLKAVDMPVNPEAYIKKGKKKAAYHLVCQLYSRYDTADEKIKWLRMNTGGLSTITAEQFKTAFPGFEEGFYSLLAGRLIHTNL